MSQREKSSELAVSIGMLVVAGALVAQQGLKKETSEIAQHTDAGVQ